MVPTTTAEDNFPFSARLPFFIDQWRKVTNNNWVLRVVEEGYKLQFNPSPPPPRPYIKTSYSSKSSSIIRALLIDYQKKGAILVVDIRPDQYVSRIFEVPKKNGEYRLILDLKELNNFIKKVHFKMDGLEDIASLICPNDYLASLDCQDAFLTIAMHPDCYKYLCFDFEGVRYCFIALVFGLTCAPRIFTKLLKVPLSYLRQKGFKNSAWLDDIFFVGSSFSSSSNNISLCQSFLESLGFIIKISKSNLIPSQSIQHVGFLWDSVKYSVSVPPEKVGALQDLCSSALFLRPTLQFVAKIIGTIESFKFGCPIAPLHYRSLQRDLIRYLSPDPNWKCSVFLSQAAKDDLLWWLECDTNPFPSPLSLFSPSHQLETDASLLGWGAFHNPSSFTQGRWSPLEAQLHINYLELKAVFLGIKALFPHSSPISLLILCDHTPTVNYINNMGGTKSRFLCSLTLEIWDYCLSHNIWLKASYLPGLYNIRADSLSRVFSDNHDYSLTSLWFTKLHSYFDFCLDIDLFASRINHHLPRYSSLLPDPGAEFIDAFSSPWSGNVYLFPPIVLLSRVINKFCSENCNFGLLIAPFIPSSPIFSAILDLCISPPIILPESAIVREARHCKTSQMMAWTISSNPLLRRDFLRKLSPDLSKTLKTHQRRNTTLTGQNLHIGVSKGKLIQAISL